MTMSLPEVGRELAAQANDQRQRIAELELNVRLALRHLRNNRFNHAELVLRQVLDHPITVVRTAAPAVDPIEQAVAEGRRVGRL